MKIIVLMVLAILTLLSLADETEEEPKAITKDIGLTIEHCHPGDEATVHVIPIPKNPRRVEGWFNTTNSLISLSDLSMLPTGLNRLEIRTICRGMTSEVYSAVFDLQRPPPKPRVGRKLIHEDTNNISMPPMPPGMAMTLPLPGGETNHGTYKDLTMMKRYFETNKRRSQ